MGADEDKETRMGTCVGGVENRMRAMAALYAGASVNMFICTVVSKLTRGPFVDGTVL